jgi:hypothetical protein
MYLEDEREVNENISSTRDSLVAQPENFVELISIRKQKIQKLKQNLKSRVEQAEFII